VRPWTRNPAQNFLRAITTSELSAVGAAASPRLCGRARHWGNDPTGAARAGGRCGLHHPDCGGGGTFPTDDVSCDFARVGARNIWAGLTGAFARQASCYFRMGWMGLKTSLDGLQGESR
jgi:hypothetical protein